MINLYPLKEFKYPVSGECVSPDVFQAKTCGEIEGLKMWEGNRQKRLGDLFKVEEDKSDVHLGKMVIRIHGDVGKVRGIGTRMTDGEIIVNGNAGFHLGVEMKGGKIVAYGNVGGWAGSMMKAGLIEIHGNAGDYLGAPYRGSSKGMRGGKIVVYGDVGTEAGACMKKGVIKVSGKAGQFLGLRMRGGTIYVEGDCEGRAGACMVDGKIIVGGFMESVLPTFTIDNVKEKVKVEEGESVEGPFYVFLGDIVENGDGKLYVSRKENPHLSGYEKFL